MAFVLKDGASVGRQRGETESWAWWLERIACEEIAYRDERCGIESEAEAEAEQLLRRSLLPYRE